jgi:phosphatidylglycerophosphate synthase
VKHEPSDREDGDQLSRLYKEYKTSLKDVVVEEAVDLFFFRPLAFVLVKLLIRLPVTPNQLSILSILMGICAGVFFSFGDPRSFVWAGLLYGLSHIFDCCDGMVARLKKNGTLIGRIIDGWADYITSVSVYLGLLIGLHQGHIVLPFSPWLLLIPSAISLFVHSAMVDYYRHEFLAHGLGKSQTTYDELAMYHQEFQRLNKLGGHWLERLMISFYLGYTRLQLKEGGAKRRYDQAGYYQANRTLLQLWNWIGASTQIAVFIASALLYQPMVYFFYMVVLGNIWMLGLLYFQVRTNRRLTLLSDLAD